MPTAVTPYSAPARWIHWLTALAILTVIPAGLVMMRLPSGPAQDQLFDLHKSVGFTVLCLAILRVIVRLSYGAPLPAPGLPRWQLVTSNAVHHALYLLIFVMPILGWAGSNAYGAPVSVFGLFTLPDLVAKNDALSDRLNDAHQALGYVTAGLVSLHILGGLWHGLVRQDGVLSRMIPALSRRGS